MIQSLPRLFASFAFRRALRGACVIFLAFLFSFYFSRTQTLCLTLISVLLTQTEVGFPLHQGLRRFFWILILGFIGAQTAFGLSTSWGLPVFITILSTLTAYVYACHFRRSLGLQFSLLILIVLLVTLLFPLPILSADSLAAIFTGATLGLSATLLIFPDQTDREFPKRITPLLRDLSAYFGALVELFLRDSSSETLADSEREAVERCWANPDETFPVWVFEAGFNPELKPGQYFFVVHLGRATEILFALHHYARYAFPKDLLQDFAPLIRDSAQRSQELLDNLQVLLEGQKLSVSQTDFMSDLPLLDELFQSKIQLSLELLDLSRDYVYLAAFIRYLKDLRLQLLQLAATLSG